MPRVPRSNLEKVVEGLARYYGPPAQPITNDPFELILLESVAYLATDERRSEAFKLLRKLVGTKPPEILAASKDDLLRVTNLGGIGAEMRAGRLREIALIATTEFDGDLRTALKLPLAKASRRCASSLRLANLAQKRFYFSRKPIPSPRLIPMACACCCDSVLAKKRRTTRRAIGRCRRQSKASW
jgi:hypothetical protein